MEELLKAILEEMQELNKKISTPKNTNNDALIDLEAFAELVDVEMPMAREISRRRDLCEKGISVNVTGKKGGTRIYWQKYLEYIGACPAVPESKRVSQKTREAM